MDPPLPARIARAAACAPKTCPLRFSRSIASQPSSVTSSHSLQPPLIEESPPALLTQTSSFPKRATAVSASARSCATSVTSVGATTARRPLPSISARSCSRSGTLRAARK